MSIRTVLAAFLLTIAAQSAPAHEWYPTGCCSGADCRPLADERVQHDPGGDGFWIDGKHHVRRGEVKRSQDGRYHGCWPSGDDGPIGCFFAPPDGA